MRKKPTKNGYKFKREVHLVTGLDGALIVAVPKRGFYFEIAGELAPRLDDILSGRNRTARSLRLLAKFEELRLIERARD